MSQRVLEVNPCVIILEWWLPSEHTDGGLLVRGALSYGWSGSGQIREEPERF